MTIIECIHTNSSCYKKHTKADPVGIVVHSTGDSSKYLKRYCQPSTDDENREQLLEIIGYNKNGNSWNRAVNKSVHYMVGLLADGTVGVVQSLPEDIAAWGVGNGKKGSYNYNPTAHIQFEIQQGNDEHFTECFNAAVNLCADICTRYGWTADRIVSHKEAHALGYASNHGDPEVWFKTHGLTMADFRKAVSEAITFPSEEPFKVGEIVTFTGQRQWKNASKVDILYSRATPCRVTIKAIYEGKKHPYLVRGTGVYGYVNAEDLTR